LEALGNRLCSFALQQSMAQHGAGQHDQWQGYSTVLAINHGIMISIGILTAVICPVMKFDVGKPWD